MMPAEHAASLPPAESGPVAESARITHLDMLRGTAVLGILLMNAVSYGLEPAAYFNLSAGGSDTWLDWAIGVFGEIFIDQKFMGIFSLLFGAGIVLFADRAAAKGLRAGWLSCWRNLLLFGIGLLHMLLWEGDILTVYAIAAPILILLRRAPAKGLLGAGLALILVIPFLALAAQSSVDPDGRQLGELWIAEGGDPSDAVNFYLLADFFLRALGMMLIGVALFRMGVLSGAKAPEFYRRTALFGLGFGLPLAALGVLITALTDFDPQIALLAAIPNTVGTAPAALGFTALIILWNMRRGGRLQRPLQAAGRMALTNYLSQTIIGILVLRVLLDGQDLTRSAVLGFVLAVWALQLLWSPVWLQRFRFGPFEWLWRVATYRKLQPLRR